MKTVIKHDKARSIYFEGVHYDTNKPIEMNFSDALRLSRCGQNVSYEYTPVDYKPSRKVNFISDIDSESGWGNASIGLLKASKNLFDIAIIGKIHNSVKDYDIITMSKKEVDPSAIAVWHEQPKESWLHSPFKKNIAIVPFETTKIPSSWVDRINKFDALFVPCKQNIEAFRNSGVKIPIELIHWGVDSARHYPIDRLPNRPFTFGTMGHLSLRKGTDILVRAFEQEFKSNENVALINKTTNPHYHFLSKDKRIKVEMTPWTHDEVMKNFYAKIDCFVFPTRGEGFGMPALEALATGIPTIATGWSGITEFLTPEVGWLIDHTMAPAKAFSEEVYKEDCGDWAEPSVDHLRKLMRYAFEHQEEVREKGKKAVQYIQEQWLWNEKAKLFHEALEHYL